MLNQHFQTAIADIVDNLSTRAREWKGTFDAMRGEDLERMLGALACLDGDLVPTSKRVLSDALENIRFPRQSFFVNAIESYIDYAHDLEYGTAPGVLRVSLPSLITSRSLCQEPLSLTDAHDIISRVVLYNYLRQIHLNEVEDYRAWLFPGFRLGHLDLILFLFDIDLSDDASFRNTDSSILAATSLKDITGQWLHSLLKDHPGWLPILFLRSFGADSYYISSPVLMMNPSSNYLLNAGFAPLQFKTHEEIKLVSQEPLPGIEKRSIADKVGVLESLLSAEKASLLRNRVLSLSRTYVGDEESISSIVITALQREGFPVDGDIAVYLGHSYAAGMAWKRIATGDKQQYVEVDAELTKAYFDGVATGSCGFGTRVTVVVRYNAEARRKAENRKESADAVAMRFMLNVKQSFIAQHLAGYQSLVREAFRQALDHAVSLQEFVQNAFPSPIAIHCDRTRRDATDLQSLGAYWGSVHGIIRCMMSAALFRTDATARNRLRNALLQSKPQGKHWGMSEREIGDCSERLIKAIKAVSSCSHLNPNETSPIDWQGLKLQYVNDRNPKAHRDGIAGESELPCEFREALDAIDVLVMAYRFLGRYDYFKCLHKEVHFRITARLFRGCALPQLATYNVPDDYDLFNEGRLYFYYASAKAEERLIDLHPFMLNVNCKVLTDWIGQKRIDDIAIVCQSSAEDDIPRSGFEPMTFHCAVETSPHVTIRYRIGNAYIDFVITAETITDGLTALDRLLGRKPYNILITER